MVCGFIAAGFATMILLQVRSLPAGMLALFFALTAFLTLGGSQQVAAPAAIICAALLILLKGVDDDDVGVGVLGLSIGAVCLLFGFGGAVSVL
jgi:hypothetical protein